MASLISKMFTEKFENTNWVISEVVNWRRIDNSMTKRKRINIPVNNKPKFLLTVSEKYRKLTSVWYYISNTLKYTPESTEGKNTLLAFTLYYCSLFVNAFIWRYLCQLSFRFFNGSTAAPYFEIYICKVQIVTRCGA